MVSFLLAMAEAESLTSPTGPYKPTWNSLSQYRAPDWYRDAKFGIWAHWGPQAVPMQGDWYARHMYEEGSPIYLSHIKQYGHPSEHGYIEILKSWKVDKWDPDRLMGLYEAAGAKFFVSMGVHHDNFDLWNSAYHRWNSVKEGPHRDIVGEWAMAARKHGLKFGVSEHLGASYTWWAVSKSADKSGSMAGVPYDGNDPDLQDLYHPLPQSDDRDWYTKNEAWHSEWYLRVNDLVGRYRPDLLYSDGGVPFGNYGLRTIANLYNQNPEAVYLAKGLETSAYVEDRERGAAKDIVQNPWQTDTSIGDWFYNHSWPYRKPDWVLKTLVDTCSKNGTLLLNIVMRPDGSLDPEVEALLKDLSGWMKVNRESIFGTRPWVAFGEGPTRVASGSFREDFPYTSKDIRYVKKGDHTLYATFLGEVSAQEVTLPALRRSKAASSTIETVELLGYDQPVSYSQTETGLVVDVPKNTSRFLTVLKISCSNVAGFDPPKRVDPPLKEYLLDSDSVKLDPAEAKYDGAHSFESRGGENNVGFWFNDGESCTWKLSLKGARKLRLTSEWASLELSELEVVVRAGANEQSTVVKLNPTGDWGAFRFVDLGTYQVPAGPAQIVVRPVKGRWKPINLRGLEVAVVKK